MFNVKDGYQDLPVEVPCGQCIGCRLRHSGEWALRCVHENSLHHASCYITLTYDPRSHPPDGSLVKKHFVDFMKRYRKFVSPQKIRFYMCGEYGDKFGRPHYHAIIFGHDFDDRVLYKIKNGIRLDTSPTLEKIWGKGFVTVGNVTFDSACYVARYITKKVTGEKAEQHYTRVDPDTGEFFKIQPEYTNMSRMPGIGREWFDQFKSDCYPSDFITHNGTKLPLPRYYDSLYEIENPEEFEKIKLNRIRTAKKNAAENTPDRRAVKEQVKLAQFKLLPRNLE